MTHFAGDVLVVDKYGYIISNMPNTTNEGTKLEMNSAIIGPVPAD
jgi:S-adenosylmethionine hydrolase